MERRNRKTNPSSLLESDEISSQRSTFRMQEPQQRPRGPSGSSRRGVTEVDGTVTQALPHQHPHASISTVSDFHLTAGEIYDDGMRATERGRTPLLQSLDRWHDPHSDGRTDGGRFGVGHEERMDQERALWNYHPVTTEPSMTTSHFQSPYSTETDQEIPVQMLTPPTMSFPLETDLEGVDLYAPPPSRPLTSGQGFPPSSFFVPPFVMDQKLSSFSSSSGSYHSFSSSSSSASSVPTHQLESIDLVRMATGIASMQLDRMEDDAEMIANQNEELYDDDLETTELTNQHRLQNEDGDTNLHLVIIYEDKESTMILIRAFGQMNLLNLPNKRQQTPLHLATITCQDDVIAQLLRNGARRGAYDGNLDTPLHIACRKGHVTCVRALHPVAYPGQALDQELRQAVESSNKEGQTCLHLAAINNHLEIVKYLIEECKVNVNLKEIRRGRTILHLAVERRNFELAHYLLNLPDSYELLVDDLTYDGYSALHIARLMSETHIEQLLLLAGAQPITDADFS